MQYTTAHAYYKDIYTYLVHVDPGQTQPHLYRRGEFGQLQAQKKRRLSPPLDYLSTSQMKIEIKPDTTQSVTLYPAYNDTAQVIAPAIATQDLVTMFHFLRFIPILLNITVGTLSPSPILRLLSSGYHIRRVQDGLQRRGIASVYRTIFRCAPFGKPMMRQHHRSDAVLYRFGTKPLLCVSTYHH